MVRSRRGNKALFKPFVLSACLLAGVLGYGQETSKQNDPLTTNRHQTTQPNTSHQWGKIGCVVSSQSFLGISLGVKLFEKKSTSLSLEGVINFLPTVNNSSLESGEKQESDYGDQYYARQLTFLSQNTTNPGSLGLGLNHQGFYAGAGISYQHWDQGIHSVMETTYHRATDKVAFPLRYIYSGTLPENETFPVYVRLGMKRESYNTFELFVQGMFDPWKKNPNARQISVGVQKYF